MASVSHANVSAPCGKNIYNIGNKTEVVKSPGYPADFPPGVQCRWIFKNLEQYSSLRLHLETLDMEDTENCDGDYLEISDEVMRDSISIDRLIKHLKFVRLWF